MLSTEYVALINITCFCFCFIAIITVIIVFIEVQIHEQEQLIDRSLYVCGGGRGGAGGAESHD